VVVIAGGKDETKKEKYLSDLLNLAGLWEREEAKKRERH
jgi:hypothetical protein